MAVSDAENVMKCQSRTDVYLHPIIFSLFFFFLFSSSIFFNNNKNILCVCVGGGGGGMGGCMYAHTSRFVPKVIRRVMCDRRAVTLKLF